MKVAKIENLGKAFVQMATLLLKGSFAAKPVPAGKSTTDEKLLQDYSQINQETKA